MPGVRPSRIPISYYRRGEPTSGSPSPAACTTRSGFCAHRTVRAFTSLIIIFTQQLPRYSIMTVVHFFSTLLPLSREPDSQIINERSFTRANSRSTQFPRSLIAFFTHGQNAIVSQEPQLTRQCTKKCEINKRKF